MALVTQFLKRDINRPSLHKEVQASISVVETDGKKLVQIDTYGRPDREIPGKVSQSLQLDERGAAELMAILKREFGQ